MDFIILYIAIVLPIVVVVYLSRRKHRRDQPSETGVQEIYNLLAAGQSVPYETVQRYSCELAKLCAAARERNTQNILNLLKTYKKVFIAASNYSEYSDIVGRMLETLDSPKGFRHNNCVEINGAKCYYLNNYEKILGNNNFLLVVHNSVYANSQPWYRYDYVQYTRSKQGAIFYMDYE